jgi:hypothetical protein
MKGGVYMSYLTKDTKRLTHLKTDEPEQRIDVVRFYAGKKVWIGVKFLEWEGDNKTGGFKITHTLDVYEEDFTFWDNTRKGEGHGKAELVLHDDAEEPRIDRRQRTSK